VCITILLAAIDWPELAADDTALLEKASKYKTAKLGREWNSLKIFQTFPLSRLRQTKKESWFKWFREGLRRQTSVLCDLDIQKGFFILDLMTYVQYWYGLTFRVGLLRISGRKILFFFYYIRYLAALLKCQYITTKCYA
jgi:hypothetical protein